MVAMVEIAFLFVSGLLFLWWFTRTNLYRANRRARRSGNWRWAPNMDYRAGYFARDAKPVPPQHPGSDE